MFCVNLLTKGVISGAVVQKEAIRRHVAELRSVIALIYYVYWYILYMICRGGLEHYKSGQCGGFVVCTVVLETSMCF